MTAENNPSESQPANAVSSGDLLAALEDGKDLVRCDEGDGGPDLDREMTVELYAPSRTLYAHGWGCAFWRHEKIAASIVSEPEKWRVKAANTEVRDGAAPFSGPTG